MRNKHQGNRPGFRIPEKDSLAETAKSHLEKIKGIGNELSISAEQLNNLQKIQMSLKTGGCGVSLFGSAVGLAGVLAVPVSGGLSLALSGASVLTSVGGTVMASEAQENLQKHTNSIMKTVNDCCDNFKRRQDELNTCFQKFQEFMEYLKNTGAYDIIKYMGTIENKIDETLWIRECDKVKWAFDNCMSGATFLCAIQSKGTIQIMQSVHTVRYLIMKSETIVKYIPEIFFSPTVLTAYSHSSIASTACASLASKAGNQTIKVSTKMTKSVVSQRIGNTVAQSKITSVAGKMQKQTTTIAKKAGTVSKLGVGLATVSIIVDAYYFQKAIKESANPHPAYEKVCDIAKQIQSFVRMAETQIEEFRKEYQDVRMLHNHLLFIVEGDESGSDEFRDYREIDDGCDEVGDILKFFENSHELLR